jgi:hypothetical protein
MGHTAVGILGIGNPDERRVPAPYPCEAAKALPASNSPIARWTKFSAVPLVTAEYRNGLARMTRRDKQSSVTVCHLLRTRPGSYI